MMLLLRKLESLYWVKSFAYRSSSMSEFNSVSKKFTPDMFDGRVGPIEVRRASLAAEVRERI